MTIELYMSNIYSINQKEYMSSILLNRGQTDIMAETTKNEKDYQGVTVEKNWSLLAFAKENVLIHKQVKSLMLWHLRIMMVILSSVTLVIQLKDIQKKIFLEIGINSM
jgi:hypothetical protein